MLNNKALLINPILDNARSGVRFSPYAYIDTTSDITFTTDNFVHKINQQKKISWGRYDRSGEGILLTLEQYFNKFVYSADFLHADSIRLIKMIGSGSSLNNLETVYKECDFTESYFAGFDEKFEGMDWQTLRLVYKKHHDTYFLIDIVHDQST